MDTRGEERMLKQDKKSNQGKGGVLGIVSCTGPLSSSLPRGLMILIHTAGGRLLIQAWAPLFYKGAYMSEKRVESREQKGDGFEGKARYLI